MTGGESKVCPPLAREYLEWWVHASSEPKRRVAGSFAIHKLFGRHCSLVVTVLLSRRYLLNDPCLGRRGCSISIRLPASRPGFLQR